MKLPAELVKRARHALNVGGGKYVVSDSRSSYVDESYEMQFTSPDAAREMVYQALIAGYDVRTDVHGSVVITQRDE